MGAMLLPAIVPAMREVLPTGAHGHAIVEVAYADETQILPANPGFGVLAVTSPSGPGQSHPA